MTEHTQITLSRAAIHNPDEPRHFMRIKPVTARIRIRLGDTLLADTPNAVRLLEIGKDFYDPMIYVQPQHLKVRLEQIVDRTSHCPLKGEASYFRYSGWTSRHPEDYLAWTYAEPYGFASQLAGWVAFNPLHVSIEETPA